MRYICVHTRYNMTAKIHKTPQKTSVKYEHLRRGDITKIANELGCTSQKIRDQLRGRVNDAIVRQTLEKLNEQRRIQADEQSTAAVSKSSIDLLMPHVWNNILVVTQEELVPSYWTADSLRQTIQRYKTKTTDQASSTWWEWPPLAHTVDSLPKHIQDSMDPSQHEHVLLQYYGIDKGAVDFFIAISNILTVGIYRRRLSSMS